MIKRLASCIRQYKKASFLTPVFMVGEVVMEVIIPILMARLIDNGIDKGNMSYITQMGLVLVIACLMSLMFGALSGKFAAIASAGFAKNLRHDMYYNVQNFSFSNIDKFSTASIVTRLTTDVTNVQNAYQMLIRIAVRAPMILIFALIMSFTINVKLACIFLITIPILGGGLFLIISNVHPIFEGIFRTYDKLNNVVQENLHGIRVVKSFVREDVEEEKFTTISEKIYKGFTKAEGMLAFNAPLMQFSMYLCLILIAWFGARMIVGGSLTTGELMSLITYAMQILMGLMMLSMVFVMIIISRASAERIVEFLDEKADLTNGENPIHEVKDGSICFENVNFSYAQRKDKLCLSDVNINIKSGETVGIIG
ncbi:MAG: ABC transporter ATP-binding protein, partial [Planctomycetia bacterium]|nr:ABC transporter ATP-binding protein [Planctomycetia bacterium]